MLSRLYEKDGKTELAFDHFKNYLLYRDSVQDIDRVQEMANLRTEYVIAEKQVQVELMAKKAQIAELKKKRQQYISLTSALVVILLIILTIGLFRRYRHIKKLDLLIKSEQIRSENLLLNILPRETAIELKTKGTVKAKKFSSVSVMFADFVSFTKHSEHLSPEDLVQHVGYYFSKFDEIMDKYYLEKIKTMGDCYMCAGGLPFDSQDHAHKIILAAFEILEFIESEKKNKKEFCWELRIGINSGPVVAGVVGNKKFAYDIWGDTVNIAARMQTASDPGKINISENTYQLIHHQFDCSYRGEIDVKNKGMMKMYFVNGIKKRTVPNGKGKIIELQSI
jgi:class 3 adenylate cyclase